MQNNLLEFGIRQNIKHSPSVLYGLEHVNKANNKVIETNQQESVDAIGGIFRDGSCGWIVVGGHIEVVSLKNGNRIADYTFGDKRYSNTFIAFATEVSIDQINTNLLAVGVHCSPTTSCIYLFAVNGSQIVHAIEVDEKLTSCIFIEPQICADSALNSFDGCIIVGTENGKIVIIDLFVESCVRVLRGEEFYNNIPKVCKILSSAAYKSWLGSEDSERYAGDSGLGVQLEDVTDSGSALSILCLHPLLIVAVGFEDGKMLLYDLCTLDAFHIAHPPEDDSPLEKFTFIEPADDPRACVYLWSFHSNRSNAFAVLHSLTYELKVVKPNGNGFVYKNFERCTPRLTMPLYEKHSKPISCQSITKFIPAEENFLTLCLLSWTSSSGAYVCVFDLNQWYKQQLPETCDWRSSSTFLAIFPLGKQPILDVWMNGVTVTPFSSLNRPEEHFYPSSLSFDCVLLTTNGSAKLHWLGLQNEALEHLNHSGPYAIVEPNRCFTEMVRASLIPQFTDYSYDMNQSLKSKREFLLSVALEYNCVNLLKRCASAWADGSHLSQNPSDGMSLSTLTEWIWNRATSIKDCCNEMCVPLFDHSGNSIEPRSQKVLLSFSRQLKRLYLLLDTIVTTHQKHIPGQVLDTLQSQRNSICMATEYQEVLQWLLNTGLLPEVNANEHQHKSYADYRDSSLDDFQAIPYPYESLKSYYTKQRRKFCEINPNFVVPATKSCRILYIDAFIENECNSAVLRSEWRKGFGDGLYPPASLQAMLRTLLVPGVRTERKYMLFVYLFMDLSAVLREERYAGVIKNLIKFPAVFKMDPGLIKITQAFWNLDHGEYELAIDDIISPLAQDQNMSMWQRELLIGALILNDVPHLALRALNAPGSTISPSLEIRTLLANDLVADAFQVQRMKRNRDLLFEFFQGCHELRKWHYLLNLSLNAKEEECLGEFLRSIDSSLGENIHFIYLLRRSKYLEAVTFIDDLHHKKRSSGHLDLDTPNTILSTYRLTMTPSVRTFSDLYYSGRDDINTSLNGKANYPKPLSTHLKQGRFDVAGGVYHQSLIHTEQMSASYWENQERKMCGVAPSNVPFLYGLRMNSSQNDSFEDKVCYPEPFVPSHKRRLNDSLENGVDAPVAKRQRLDCSNINSTLLTSFKVASAHQSQVSTKNLNNSAGMDDDDTEMLQTTLSTPVVQNHKNAKKSFSLLERIGTPQSILKSRSSYRGKSVSSVASRRSVDSDERSIRFTLPNDDTTTMCASTPITHSEITHTLPVVPNVFNFGVTQRPSIHSERSPSKLILNERNTVTTFESSGNCTQSTSPGRKRLRSISPDALSNVTTCIDVSIEQSYEPQSRQLFVSSEDSNDQDGEDMETESTNKPQTTSDATIKSSDDHSVTSPVKADRTTGSIDQFPAPVLTKAQIQPVERIIPIEVEARPAMPTFESSLEGRSLLRGDTVKRRSSIGLGAFSVSIESPPMQRNILTDSDDYYEPSYASYNYSDESAFQQRNLLTSTGSFTDSISVNTTRAADASKTVEETDVIETFQIVDSDDDSCDISENVGTKSTERPMVTTISEEIISVENDEKTTYTSSTPFTSQSHNVSPSIGPFDASSDSFATTMFRKRNILTDSTVKDVSYYNHSTWDQSSMFKSRNILTDSTYKDDSVSTLGQSSALEHRERGTIDGSGSLLSRKGNADANPIVIDITDRTFKDRSVFNDDYSNDIYDLSSEVDAGLRDDDYDVDDYESDSEDDDDVIDISSGTEDVADTPIISKCQKTSGEAVTLPPCSTLGKRDAVDVNMSTHVLTNTNPVDDSKCSEMSFATASEHSIMHTTTSNTSMFDHHLEVKDVLRMEDVQQSDIVQQQICAVEEHIEKCLPTTDFIGVVDASPYNDIQSDQNQVTITYELPENLLADHEINVDATEYAVEYATQNENDLVSSALNDALLHPDTIQSESVVIPSHTLTEYNENLNDAVMSSQDTIPTVTESHIDVTERSHSESDGTTTLTHSKDVFMSADGTELDLNAGVLLDTITVPDTTQQASDSALLGDTYVPDETNATNGDLNVAIVCNELESQIEPMEVTSAESGTTSQNNENVQQQQAETEMNVGDGGEVVLDIDELLESAVEPEIRKMDEESVQPEKEQNVNTPAGPSTSVDALKQSIAENTPKRRLRSNSEATIETPPTTMTRRRSLKPTESITLSTPRLTRAKSETKTPSNQTPVSSRVARAKSEMKLTPSLSVVDSIESTTSDSIPKKLKRAASRRNVNSPVTTLDTGTTSAAVPHIVVTRSRTRSIAEDDDDGNVSVASGVSQKSTKSTSSRTGRNNRNTRTKSDVAVDDEDADDDDGSSTVSKKSRSKPKLLPVISEDASQEIASAETQSYEDNRRLTRRQKEVMNRAAEKAKNMVPPSSSTVTRKRQRKTSTADPDDDEDVSDTASVASSMTNASGKSRKSTDHLTPVRQSKRLLEKEGSVDPKSLASKDSDSESVVSTARSTRSRRRSTSSTK